MLGRLFLSLDWIFRDYIDISISFDAIWHAIISVIAKIHYLFHCQILFIFVFLLQIFSMIYTLHIYFSFYIYYFILQTNSYNLKFTWYPLANHSIAVSTSFYLLINPIAFIQLVTHMEGYFFFFKSKVQCSVKPTIRNVTRFYLFYNGIIKPW